MLYVPGGVYLGSFNNIIAMSQNLLPFEKYELKKFFPQKKYFRLYILRQLQVFTFNNSKAIIFLTNYAKNKVIEYIKPNINYLIAGNAIQIKENQNFIVKNLDTNNKIKIIYVSQIDIYKHQTNVLKAIHMIMQKYKFNI